jgi:hypothetical protein
MMCAVTVRQIRPDSYDEFRKAWEPDPWLPRLERALVLRNEDNPDQVLTIGFFDADQETLDTEVRDDPAVLQAEERRLRRISEFEERVLLNGIFELTEEVLRPT